MTDQRATANALMCALIKGVYGNLDAAAETINARWGRGASSKGTLSKRMSVRWAGRSMMYSRSRTLPAVSRSAASWRSG